MPADIRVITAHEFMTVTPEGRLDFEASRRMLVEIAEASDAMTDYDVVLDTRNAQLHMSVTDLWYLASELHGFGREFPRKTAVIVPPNKLDYAGFFALCAKERGFKVGAFSSMGDAMTWLTEPDE